MPTKESEGAKAARSGFRVTGGRIILAVLVFFLGATVIVEPIRVWVLWRSAHLGSGPTCRDPGWLEPVDLINAQATSYLPTDEGVTYFPGNSADGDLATAWIAKHKDEGPPLSISWTLPKPDVVRLICITPGYAKSADRFMNNQRLKTFSLSMGGSQRLVSIPPADARDYQSFVSVETLCLDCESMGLTIVDTYPTEKGNAEVAISEVRAYRDARVWPLRLLPW